jgi:ribonuclease HII
MARTTLTTEQLQQQGLEKLRNSDLKYVIGVDEVGYGAWAGPVCVCAVVVRSDWVDKRVKDSKLLAPVVRKELVKSVLVPPTIPYECTLMYDSDKIDEMGVSKARDALMRLTVDACFKQFPEALVVLDGNRLLSGLPAGSLCMPKADDLVPAVSAASVIAKVTRDIWMCNIAAAKYPGYDFEHNVGYGTARHNAALVRLGVTPIHRKSYQNIKALLQK